MNLQSHRRQSVAKPGHRLPKAVGGAADDPAGRLL